MGKKYGVIIHRINRHTVCCLLIFLVIPHQLFAIPRSIARIVRTLEGQNKQKKAQAQVSKDKALSKNGLTNAPQAADPSLPSNAQQARLAVDEAIKDNKLINHPATWYYRGVIYDRLLRDHIVSEEASILLDEAVAAYTQAKQLSVRTSKQFHGFSLNNLAALWRYFLNRGMAYYRQEEPEQAIEQFTICRRILPEKACPLLYMAIVYHSADQPQEALRYYQDYLAVEGPQCMVARAMAVIHYHKLKNFDKAIAILNEALLQFPFNNELLEEKCLIYEASGKMDDYALSLAAGLQHKETDACYAYAYLLEYQGRTQEAIGYYQQVLKNHPCQYETLRQMGLLFYNEAIKLYVHTLKSVGDQAQLENAMSTDWCRLMQVTVRPLLPHVMGWVGSGCCLLPIWGSWRDCLPKQRPLSIGLTWVVYDHPLMKYRGISTLGHLVQTGNLPHTSPLYGYIHTKNATALAHNKWTQTTAALEKWLNKSLHCLKLARAQDKKDKTVAQSLYYSYYLLKKYRSAYRLLQAMQKRKQYLEDDPLWDIMAK